MTDEKKKEIVDRIINIFAEEKCTVWESKCILRDLTGYALENSATVQHSNN